MEYTEFDNLVAKWQNNCPSIMLLKEYLPMADRLLYTNEKTVRKITALLSKNIKMWADQHSSVYRHIDKDEVITKTHLLDKTNWYVKQVENESADMATSGSTTGVPFAYRRWDKSLRAIEIDNHYKPILHEFNLSHNPKVMYLINNHTKPGDLIQILQGSANFTEQHGADKAEVHFVQKNDHQDRNFYNAIIDHLEKFPVDVILTTGQYVNRLVRHLQLRNVKNQIAKLLSNTCEMLDKADADYLINNKLVQWTCDHMRCWDGGSGFFTCKEGIYHATDQLSHTWEGEGNKLISTDYFNLASPFVNYWNGDFCKIEDKYYRCGCGRLFRPFQFLQNRAFALKGNNTEIWREAIARENITGIIRIACDVDTVEIISHRIIPLRDRIKLSHIMKGFEVKFTANSV